MKSKEEIKEKQRLYYINNKERIKKQTYEYMKIHWRKYNDKNRAKRKERVAKAKGFSTYEEYLKSKKESVVLSKKLKSYRRSINPVRIEKMYKRGAIERNIEYSLMSEEYKRLINNHCFYCNLKYEILGFDRVDNSKGYHKENIVVCCKRCNFMKSNQTKDEFIERCKNIANKFK